MSDLEMLGIKASSIKHQGKCAEPPVDINGVNSQPPPPIATILSIRQLGDDGDGDGDGDGQALKETKIRTRSVRLMTTSRCDIQDSLRRSASSGLLADSSMVSQLCSPMKRP